MPEPNLTNAAIMAGMKALGIKPLVDIREGKITPLPVIGQVASKIFGGGLFGGGSKRYRRERQQLSFNLTAQGKEVFNVARANTALSSGQLIDVIEDVAKYHLGSQEYSQRITYPITFGGQGFLDVQNRTVDELARGLVGAEIQAGDVFGSAGVFLPTYKSTAQAAASIYKNLNLFDPGKAQAFKERVSDPRGVGYTMFTSNRPEEIFLDLNTMQFREPSKPKSKSPIGRELARLALQFVPKARAPRFRTGFVPAGGTFEQQAKEQDLIIPPGFTMKQPTTLSRAIDPNILNGIR